VKLIAGASAPASTYYYSRYGISKGKVTCTRCHDPHADIDVADPDLLRSTIKEEICRECHTGWWVFGAAAQTVGTHPVGMVYSYPSDPGFKAAVDPTNGGLAGSSSTIQLISGMVACSSCHRTHFADSNATTADGIGLIAAGDGFMLRSDGPYRTGGTRNGASGTAQLRSNLCQACHTIELHGQGLTGDHKIGCLDCHGGHAYNGGTPNAYMLNILTPGAVPTRPDRVNGASVQVTFNNYPAGGSTRTKWADENQGGANGFCEKCHGDANSVGMVSAAAEHGVGNTNECTACHKHNDPANLYSFNRDASAATCGQCHGFPPYLNSPGDRTTGGVDGGYAVNESSDPNTPYDYVTSTTYEKNETQTAHKTHAGSDLPTSPAGGLDWYFVGSAGVDNCKVCHGPDAGSGAGGHREAPVTRPNTFRDVPFDAIAQTGGMIPAYNINSPWTCTNVYCHTNGSPYNGASRPNRVYTRVNTTPSWVGTGANYAAGGFGSIYNQASRCASCHGNTAANMATGTDPLKSNSVAHQAHLGGTTTLNMGKVFGCKICHVNTADSSTALTAGAMDGRTGGKHVNGLIDVDFETGSTPNTLPEALTGSTFTATTGVCSTYCHNVTGAGGAMAADWDVATDMQCDSCHGGLVSDSAGNGGYGPVTSVVHTKHTASTGANIACGNVYCHGDGVTSGTVNAGTHDTHFNGVVNFGSCDPCHGVEAGEGGSPVWTSTVAAQNLHCETCHAGSLRTSYLDASSVTRTANNVSYAPTSGHNRPTASGNYPGSGNLPANVGCTDCHVETGVSTAHLAGGTGDTLMLRTDVGFPATYSGNQNAYCNNCHGTAPAHPTKSASAATRSINTHRSKLCIACHNIHGDQNLQMIWASQTDQINHDPSATGKYGAAVAFSNATDFTAGNQNSYDEDDGAVGGAGEVNSDDICATCHSVGAGTAHNEVTNSTLYNGTGTHYQGGNCFTCHASHTDATDAFKLGAGTACNDCHGFPPATGAHRKGTLITDPELHSNTTQNLLAEDRTDCAWCHTGAGLYTYDVSADQANADPNRNNHGVSQANRRTVLTASVGYETTNFSCTTACHASSNGDGEWDDVNGLNCNACHYASASPTGASNTAAGARAVSAVHNEHFDKSKGCAQCHDVSYSAAITAIRGVLTHIIAPDYTGAGNDGTLLQGRAQAALDEATVVRAPMVYSGGVADAAGTNNTCSGTGFGLGCHASGTADWDVVIPATSAGCVMCHTETNTAAYNPTSGIHDNSPTGPTVTGNAHDGSFDNGSAGIADCVTCHTASPTAVATNHINGTLNTGTAITVAAAAGYTQASGTCATTCHSAGTVWSYKWSNTAFNTDGTECANCHGDYTGGWNTGVAPHTENPTRGNKHNNVGTLTYPCSDCHAIGSAGYNWTSKWDPTGTNSNHGDEKITMNQVAGTNAFAIDASQNPDRAGCTTTSCHNQLPTGITGDTSHTLRVTTTSFITQTVTGNAPSVSCSGCHGGTVGTNANGYWPDGVNAVDNGVEDNSGAHQKHITALAKSKYNETLAQLLTDNGNGTADAKQKFLCAYCHNTPGSDADHGIVANLPAEVNSMYALWDLTRSTPDNAVFTPASGTCGTSDCHYNKTTPTTPTSYVWYSGSTSACIMCHVDVTAEAKHTAHTGAAATFGRTITCDDCHKTATETVSWGSPGTPPTNNHINGSLTVTGTVTFTYDGLKSCGTNDCHEDGKGGTPKTASYPWNGAALGNCTICHDASPTTDAHSKHLAAKVSSYVPGSCNDCHPAASNAAHINNSVSYASKISTAPGNGSCTNTCHLSAEAGDWTGGSAAIACTDCHNGSGASAYIGGDKTSVPGPNYMPQYAMHLTVPTVSGKVHTDTGLPTTCAFCHSNMAAQATTHPNGVWTADDADNTNDQNRGMFAAFIDGSPATCATSCHSAGTSWRYKWSATAANTTGGECANCHGDYANGWNTGVGHAVNPTRGNTSTHNDTGTLSYACTACHVIGATTVAYPWTTGTNDWYPNLTELRTTLHGDGKLTINNNGTTHVRHENPVGTWKSGCKGCHDGPSNDGIGADDANHDYAVNIATAPSTVRWALWPVAGDAAAAAGGCDGCHNSGTAGQFWPGHLGVYPSRAGKHLEHVRAIAVEYFGSDSTANRNNACDFCHLNPGEAGHNDNVVPANVNNISHILTKAADSNPVVNGAGTAYVTCSTVDCHFDNAVTPHWYTDDVAPAQVTLTAVPGPTPRSIKVTWNAPGDDGNVANTTPYVYDLRYGTSGATATNFALTEDAQGWGPNYAGNLPAAYNQGYASEAIIENLAPATTYYFSLKTRDTAGNWSTASATANALPTVDTQAPAFGGANKATKGDSNATVYLDWTPAEDHSMPITYKVWRVAKGGGSGPLGALDMDADTPILTGIKGHSIRLTSAAPDSLVNDTVYYFGVRACDANNNCDTNDQIVSATPTAEPQVTMTNHTYRTNNTAGLLTKDGAFGATGITGASLASTGLILAPSANIPYQVTYYADTFAVYLNAPTSGPSTVTAEFGSYNGSTFTSLLTKTISVAARADRVYQFKFDGAGRIFAANLRPAVRLKEVTTNGVLANYGTVANRGDLTMAERIVNALPVNPALNATVSVGSPNVNITWNNNGDGSDGVADTVHYDLFGSDDNGASYRYLIAKDLPAATVNYTWNTQKAGIAGSATVAVQLLPGDGYGHYTGAVTTKTDLAINNSNDLVAPGTISDLTAKARPKAGSVQLTWTAQGDDADNNGRAKYYDIRYSTSAITEGNFAAATQCVNEPSPDFGGEIQHFEVTGLTPGQNYYFAIKTYDEGTPANVSAISTAKIPGVSDQGVGGPRCGMCHTTAPSVVESVGNHKLHGFTINDCTKCHGAAVTGYGLDHQDGQLTMGYGPGGAHEAIIAGNRIYYTDNGLAGGTVLYDDTNGFGGFGSGNYVNVGDGVDNGTCINFGALGVGGCHSSAGSDPDGAGSLPTYPTPTWNAAATLNCAACHGNPNRTVDSFYGRGFDAGLTDQIKGAPVVDNRGNYNLADPDEKDRKYIGQHEKHLNYSFRFSKGDSCNLCHAGNYSDVNNLDGRHANGEVDVKLDLSAAGTDAIWTPGTATTAGTCGQMSADSCHPYAALPAWDSNESFDCVGCHNMGGVTPSHVTDPNQNIDLIDNDPQNDPDGAGPLPADPMQGNCTWCHFGGHPRDDVGGTALILENSSQVGINYKSGGIHLKKTIGARAAAATEAELCWSCHDANTISEWGTDAGGNNASTRPANASDYNYGTVNSGTSAKWITSPGVGAAWSSPVGNFSYKNGAIKSTHSTNALGTSAISGALKARVESVDAVGNIRCSNCHDVHNLNKAPGDSMTGQPYLRGSWIRNPYPEDGAPWNKTYTSVNKFGAVPRGGARSTTTPFPPNNQQGGYQIDQNNDYPTAGLSLATSAGLCTLCHGTNVDSMDRYQADGTTPTDSVNFWVGSAGNGHSNAALGGTASKASNIFGWGIGGRPTGNNVLTTGTTRTASDVFDMGLQYTMNNGTPGTTRGLSYRSTRYAYLYPQIANDFAYQDFDWGVTVDAGSTDIGYHAFTCSKCHNPHASRLPKLMITNCLDTGRNTWQTTQGRVQNFWSSTADNGEYTATHNTAQNCHRFDAADDVGGWNTVTPWQP
jgi:predicted CXXCH cytochrome family protein